MVTTVLNPTKGLISKGTVDGTMEAVREVFPVKIRLPWRGGMKTYRELNGPIGAVDQTTTEGEGSERQRQWYGLPDTFGS